ncbi:jg10592 [Pararge aegeria aegeria]|uniref:Jg10592 protein n=1 Tax=Pararge aegeria aegeria TaxID=348720 RepID=A0A8S4RWE9_9NEOP|nr:jg10592 [Pararge aegeria aegeria]
MLKNKIKNTINNLKKKHPHSACGCPSNRRSGLQSEEPPHNTRRFKDYCLLYPTLDPTTKRKLLKMLVFDRLFSRRPLTETMIGTITVD